MALYATILARLHLHMDFMELWDESSKDGTTAKRADLALKNVWYVLLLLSNFVVNNIYIVFWGYHNLWLLEYLYW